MPNELGKRELLAALTALGARALDPVRLVLGGSAALILVDAIKRPTSDGDVVRAEPELNDIQPLVRRAADAAGVPQGWLNTSIQAYLDALPLDYADRIHWLPPFRRLTVGVLDRRDVLTMKVYAQRPRDVADIAAMQPTRQEMEFVRRQLPRVARSEPARAATMQTLLDDWDARLVTHERDSPAPKPPRRRQRP